MRDVLVRGHLPGPSGARCPRSGRIFSIGSHTPHRRRGTRSGRSGWRAVRSTRKLRGFSSEVGCGFRRVVEPRRPRHRSSVTDQRVAGVTVLRPAPLPSLSRVAAGARSRRHSQSQHLWLVGRSHLTARPSSTITATTGAFARRELSRTPQRDAGRTLTNGTIIVSARNSPRDRTLRGLSPRRSTFEGRRD